MHQALVATAARLSDAELLRQVVSLAGREREATVDLVGHLAELDSRKLHLAEGYGSLFSYCTGALCLTEHAAYNRIEAARLSRRFPVILDLLADGSLNVSTARLLAPHLRPDNFESVAAQARGRSKRDVEVLVARLAPRPDVVAAVRRLPLPRAETAPPPAMAESAATILPTTPAGESEAGTLRPSPAGPDSQVPSAAAVLAPPPPRPMPRPLVSPLAPERYRVEFTIGAATHDKLRQVQDLVRREIPDGDPGQIFDRALTLLLEDVARKKLAATTRPRHGTPPRPGSRLISARVRRAVWLRDGGQCAFVGANGRRCSERTFLEFHHCEPYAIGGEPTIVNISLRCRAHNVYESELVFGPEVSVPGRRRGNSPRGELRPSSSA